MLTKISDTPVLQHILYTGIYLVCACLGSNVYADAIPETLQNPPSTMSNPKTAIANKPSDYPTYTAAEIWSKLLTLIAVPEGKVTRSQIEQAFGLQLHAAQVSNSKIFAIYTPQIALAFSDENMFSFNWGDGIGGRDPGYMYPKDNMCIAIAEYLDEIKQWGWKLEYERRVYPWVEREYSFRQGASAVMRVRIDDDTKCMLSMFIFRG